MTYFSGGARLLLCGVLIFFSLPAVAQENISLSLAVVDVDKILSDSKAAKSIKKQVESKRKGFLSEVKEAEEGLRDDQKAIAAQREDLSKEDLLKKVQDFEKDRLKAQKTIQERKSKLDQAYARAINTLTDNIYKACQEIADERGIDLIITRQNIIVGSMSLDITDEVMERLNKKTPKITLNVN